MFVYYKKVVPLQRQNKRQCFKNLIGLWCNGNTTDSGPVFLGSNPSNPTKIRSFQNNFWNGLFLVFT